MNEEMSIEAMESVEDAATGEQAVEQGKEKQEPEKKYTDEDLDRIIARKIAAERKKITKMFNEEQQESELETRERNVLKRELMADAKNALLDEGLPMSLASLLNYSSKEEYDISYENATTIFREALGKEFKRQLSGSTPRAGYAATDDREKEIHEVFSPKARR